MASAMEAMETGDNEGDIAGHEVGDKEMVCIFL